METLKDPQESIVSISDKEEANLLMDTDTQDSGVSGAADKLNRLKVRKRLTTAERKLALKAKLAEQGIPWGPKKFSGNNHRYKKRQTDSSQPNPVTGKRRMSG